MCATGKLCIFSLVLIVYQCAIYQTANGQHQREVIDALGNIRGTYSYVDPTGRIVVKHTSRDGGYQFHTGLNEPVQYYRPPKQHRYLFSTSRNPFAPTPVRYTPAVMPILQKPSFPFVKIPQKPSGNPFMITSTKSPVQDALPETDPKRNEIPTAESLFTPAVVQYPAETPGQVEEYRKALEEEAKEAAKETTTQQSVLGQQGYVKVNIGENQSYKYLL